MGSLILDKGTLADVFLTMVISMGYGTKKGYQKVMADNYQASLKYLTMEWEA